MTHEQLTVLGAVPAAGHYGETAHRIARKVEMLLNTVLVILEHVLLVLGLVKREYRDRTWLWAKAPRGDREAGRAPHAR